MIFYLPIAKNIILSYPIATKGFQLTQPTIGISISYIPRKIQRNHTRYHAFNLTYSGEHGILSFECSILAEKEIVINYLSQGLLRLILHAVGIHSAPTYLDHQSSNKSSNILKVTYTLDPKNRRSEQMIFPSPFIPLANITIPKYTLPPSIFYTTKASSLNHISHTLSPQISSMPSESSLTGITYPILSTLHHIFSSSQILSPDLLPSPTATYFLPASLSLSQVLASSCYSRFKISLDE